MSRAKNKEILYRRETDKDIVELVFAHGVYELTLTTKGSPCFIAVTLVDPEWVKPFKQAART